MELKRLFIGIFQVSSIICFHAQWTKIFVDKPIIDLRMYVYQSFAKNVHFANDLAVIQFISEHSEALLACFLTETQLLFHGGMFSPLYRNQTQDTYTCFTRMNKDFVFGSTITGLGPPLSPSRSVENLIKGYYNGNHATCLHYYSSGNPKWILVDFGQPKTFTTVSITSIVTDNIGYILKTGHIWISNSTTVNGDFSTYKHFGSFPDFISGQTLDIKKQNGQKVTAQYVGIQQTTSTHSMMICDLRIY